MDIVLKKIDEIHENFLKQPQMTYFQQSILIDTRFLKETCLMMKNVTVCDDNGRQLIGNDAELMKVRRVVSYTKIFFIDIIASFEYEIKLFVKHSTDKKIKEIQHILNKDYKTPISQILLNLNQNSFLSDNDYQIINALFKIRNFIVHNDTRPNTTKVYSKIKKIFAVFEIDRFLNGKPEMFLILLELLSSSYKKWYETNHLVLIKIKQLYNELNKEKK